MLPLAIYLLTFIICFDNPRWYKRLPFGLALALVLAAICWTLFQEHQAMDCFILGLFVCCMFCHGELYRLKPQPEHLTAYYNERSGIGLTLSALSLGHRRIGVVGRPGRRNDCSLRPTRRQPALL